jgi:hypothetical protein
MKAGGLEPQPFYFFFGCDVEIVFYGFRISHPVIQQAGYFDPPSFCFGFHLELISGIDLPGRLDLRGIVFYLALFTGSRGQASGFEKPDGPEILVDAEFFFFCQAVQFENLWIPRLYPVLLPVIPKAEKAFASCSAGLNVKYGVPVSLLVLQSNDGNTESFQCLYKN